MKIKVPKRFTTAFLSVLLGVGMASTGCNNDKLVGDTQQDTSDDKSMELVIDEVEEDTISWETSEQEEFDEEEEIEIPDDVLEHLETHKLVAANNNVKLREEPSSKSKQIGFLIKGNYLKYIEKLDNGWYKVEYNDSIAYVSEEYVDYIECYELPYNDDVPFLDDEHDLYDYFDFDDVVIATGNVNIRKEPNTDCEKLGLLEKNSSLPFVSKVNEDWYEVEYNGETAYVSSKYSKESKGYTPLCEMSDMVYMTKRASLFDVADGEVVKEIPKNEIAKVYAQTDDYYLVQSCGSFGLISKKYCQSLGNTYIIIDISDQTLQMYIDDKLFVDNLVVTGKKSTPTYCGIFDVYKKGTDIYWKEFDVTVKYGLAFNRGIWIHDATWRKTFGPSVKDSKRSHGCVNEDLKTMTKIYENADIGTPVLVKK